MAVGVTGDSAPADNVSAIIDCERFGGRIGSSRLQGREALGRCPRETTTLAGTLEVAHNHSKIVDVARPGLLVEV